MRQIPAAFKMLGHTVKVVLSDQLGDDTCGRCHPGKLLIEVEAPEDGTPVSLTAQVFLHEWVHMAMHKMGRYELYEDEEFVDQLAELMYQFLATKRGKAVLSGDAAPAEGTPAALVPRF